VLVGLKGDHRRQSVVFSCLCRPLNRFLRARRRPLALIASGQRRKSGRNASLFRRVPRQGAVPCLGTPARPPSAGRPKGGRRRAARRSMRRSCPIPPGVAKRGGSFPLCGRVARRADARVARGARCAEAPPLSRFCRIPSKVGRLGALGL